ncbi:MAG: DMT family transporter [Actinomycetia bacterium]|nr:DMT family transporter [Actinomycetes bacterium]
MNDTPSPQAVAAMRRLTSSFFKKGLLMALASGIIYGLFSVFVSQGMAVGPWADWYGDNTSMLSVFVLIYVLGLLGSGLNDLISAIWMTGNATVKGKFMDFLRCFKSKPGLVMIVCALIGGPIANGAYIVALSTAGPMAAPITALCPAIGAIIGRVAFKQELNARMVIGILICLIAAVVVGSAGITDVDASPNFLLGMIIALVAAFGWGIEGAVAGYGTTLIDYEISVSIRQTASGIITLFVVVPVLCVIAGNIGLWGSLVGQVVSSPMSMTFFIAAGLCAGFSFALWYKGNSMTGAALGMACNGTYSFFVPLFSWLILGLILGKDGFALAPIQWLAAVVMVIGIFLIAVNPLDFFKKKQELEA